MKNKTNGSEVNPVLVQALALAKRGWYVYPTPAKNGPAHVKWRTGSSCDPKTITGWWRKWPNALLCLDCGRSKVAVIDADSIKGHGVDGAATLFDLELAHEFLPTTLMSKTAGDGTHYFFNDPDGKMKSTAGALGAGVDTRGVGGMVVLAPSHVKGKGVYKWLNELPLADLPHWVVDLAGAAQVRGAVPDSEFDSAYTAEQFAERLALIDVKQFDGKHDEWIRFLMSCTHSTTVEDGKDSFMKWTCGWDSKTQEFKGEYAADYDLIAARWDYNFSKRNVDGKVSKVGTFNKYLIDAGHDDLVLRGNETEAKADFDDEETAAAKAKAEAKAKVPPTPEEAKAAKAKHLRKIKSLLKKTAKNGCTAAEAEAALAKAKQLMVTHGVTDEDIKADSYDERKKSIPKTASYDDFYFYAPENKYFYTPNRALWPSATMPKMLDPFDIFRMSIERPTHGMTWCPGMPLIVKDRSVLGGGWKAEPGHNTINTYIPPDPLPESADARKAAPWVKLVVKIFGKKDARHIISWMAYRAQHPEIKVNHALVLGSKSHGIGKDTMLVPLIRAVGEWNFKDISAEEAMNTDFNPFLESVVLRINEAKDLGDVDRVKFYDHTKTFMAAPPNLVSVADKNVKRHPVFNLTGPIITTNHLTDGLYLKAEDRRHYVAWSEITEADFAPGFWDKFWEWYESGGIEHAAAYLMAFDTGRFNPKEPPPKTEAFWEIVHSARSAEDTDLANVLDRLGIDPLDEGNAEWPLAVTLDQIVQESAHTDLAGFHEWLTDRRNARKVAYRMEGAGYSRVRNTDDKRDGLWRMPGRRTAIYVKTGGSVGQRTRAAAALVKRIERRMKREAARKAKAGTNPGDLADIG
jgi:hypothetical protein